MKWRKYEKHWMDGDFKSLDPDFIDAETEDLARWAEKKNFFY